MPRKLLTILLATIALVASGLAVAPSAQAAWSRPGELTRYKLCRGPVPGSGGETWRFVSRVTKRTDTPDARAGIRVFSPPDGKVAQWSTGWLEDGETRIFKVRVDKSRKVVVRVWHEAGDRDSAVGTAHEMVRLKPMRIRRCNA